jgi:hypothetical protein
MISIPDYKEHVYIEDQARKLVAKNGFSVDDTTANRLPSDFGKPSSILQQTAIAYPTLGHCYFLMGVKLVSTSLMHAEEVDVAAKELALARTLL